MTAPVRVGVVSWDWREQPDLSELARVLTGVSDGVVHLREVRADSSDQYAIVVSNVPLDDARVAELYERYIRSLDDLDGEDQCDCGRDADIGDEGDAGEWYS